MKTLFITNSYAGSVDRTEPINRSIREFTDSHPDMSIETYSTQYVGDAEDYADRWCSQNESEDVLKVFACGGDGTINEVLNGVIRHKNVYLGIIPIGTGNDFCRNFPGEALFMDVTAQI